MSDQLLHLVFGGRVKNPQTVEFEDSETLHIVGIFPNYATAYNAWKSVSHAHVDDASTKYVIVHLHKLLEPDN